MIINPRTPLPLVPTARRMHTAGFAFHPTGSRYLGGAHELSDWDFVAQDTPELRWWLEAEGFSRHWNTWSPYRTDGFTAAVYSKGEYNQHHYFQVQLTPHLHAKLYARNQILAHRYEEHLNATDAERSALWNTLCTQGLDLYKQGNLN